jgi:hypothetical protein
MFIQNFHRFADFVCSRDAPFWMANYWDIVDAKGGQVFNLLSGYTETNSIHDSTTANFVLENVNKK